MKTREEEGSLERVNECTNSSGGCDARSGFGFCTASAFAGCVCQRAFMLLADRFWMWAFLLSLDARVEELMCLDVAAASIMHEDNATS